MKDKAEVHNELILSEDKIIHAAEVTLRTIRKDAFIVKDYDAALRSERSYNDGQWHHVALSVDRTNNEAVLYVDGEVAAREAADKTGHWNDEVVNLGRYYYYSLTQHKIIESDRLQGYLDEITLWNSPLTENVIRQKMNEKLDGSEIGLLAYMPFSEDIQQASGGAAQQEFTDKYFFSQWDTETQEYVSNY